MATAQSLLSPPCIHLCLIHSSILWNQILATQQLIYQFHLHLIVYPSKRQRIAAQQQEHDNHNLGSPEQRWMPSQSNVVQVNWNGQQLQLTPGIARQLAAAQNTGASALQEQDEDIDMPTPSDSPTLRPINLGQQAPQIIVNQGPANAPNPLPAHQNLAQPVQQENVGLAQNLRTMRNEASFPFYVDYHCPHTSY
ncbi:hypothetical protein DFH08DRAFT_797023 [Mycena albidolilacea]|uniref:Uncharacterized protein n=1 Tax=Mycena albidolilacea TaxID=1033008 RepID=A0AAD7AWY0_9AGAR|nr:hypothetical protein DFH08DRAFT_797023 [Mycena albidolilacea]